MPSVLSGTFATGSTACGVGSQASGALPIPTSKTSMRLTLTGLDALNTCRTEKRTSPGGAWATQVSYNSNQSSVSVPVATGEEWRVVLTALQPVREIRYALDLQS
jgi:hypothetical protein